MAFVVFSKMFSRSVLSLLFIDLVLILNKIYELNNRQLQVKEALQGSKLEDLYNISNKDYIIAFFKFFDVCSQRGCQDLDKFFKNLLPSKDYLEQFNEKLYCFLKLFILNITIIEKEKLALETKDNNN